MKHRPPKSLFPGPRPILTAALLALGALGAVACESSGAKSAAEQAGHADLSFQATAKAAVVSVDKASRTVTLRDEDGSLFAVQCGPAVRNFDQISAGDQLNVTYQETLSATRLPPGSSVGPVQGGVIAGRAMPGEKPAGGVGMAASVRVKIESVDRDSFIVVFSLSSGELRSVRAVRPEGQQFVKTLKVGDIVQLDYTAALALAIDKS